MFKIFKINPYSFLSKRRIKKSFLTAAFILGMNVAASAQPPSAINLDYDSEQKILHIAVDHVTHNINKHYIRKIVVYLNEVEFTNFHFSKQTSPSQMLQDVTIGAKKDDMIRVQAQCTQSGPRDAMLVVP